MRKLCAVFAHPDDESFSAGAALARYADQGVEVTLVTATSGEAGEVGTAPVDRKELAAWRERELLAAATAIGIHHVRLLRFPDGTLPDRLDDLVAAITAALRDIRPQVVITEDVQGITGHPDHIAVTHAVVRTVDDLGESGPLKLYEHVLPQSTAPETLNRTPDDYITTSIDVEAWRDRMLAGLEAHSSQVGPEMLRRFRGFPSPWLDHYICVRTRVPILIPEKDLFDGIASDETRASDDGH
jgi:LmbE family N-acetylglucosaminyl deacetylase